jgi:predicted Zn-dependent protease with MMP-like domain
VRAIEAEHFEQLVADAIDSLPDEFAMRLDNVGIVVSDEPTAEELASARVVGGTLFGLYHGVPQTQRHEYAWRMPDKISIYRGPITRACGDDDDAIEKLVRHVVIHEIAHHFGISDARLRELGAY